MPKFTLRVNGRTHEVDGEAGDSLLAVLRSDLGLTGSKFGCGEGYCGACSVLIDYQVVRSCTARLGAVAGKTITTIEGIAPSASGAERAAGPAERSEPGGVQGPPPLNRSRAQGSPPSNNARLHPVQEAFIETEAFQCGYCTPGMVIATIGLLRTNPDPSDQDIARVLDRNVCRCGTYPRIVQAVKLAAQRLRTQTLAEARGDGDDGSI